MENMNTIKRDKQHEYQKKYDAKTKTIQAKYGISDMKDFDRLQSYLRENGLSTNSFVKMLINQFFEQQQPSIHSSNIKIPKNWYIDKEYIKKLYERVPDIKLAERILAIYVEETCDEITEAMGDKAGRFENWIEKINIEAIEIEKLVLDELYQSRKHPLSEEDKYTKAISQLLDSDVGHIIHS